MAETLNNNVATQPHGTSNKLKWIKFMLYNNYIKELMYYQLQDQNWETTGEN